MRSSYTARARSSPVAASATVSDLPSSDSDGPKLRATVFSALSFAPSNLLWFAAVGRVGAAARASVYINLQPFFGALSALLLLSEEIHTLQWAGGIVIVAGIILSRIQMTRIAVIEVKTTAYE